jgi:hypothetical protein
MNGPFGSKNELDTLLILSANLTRPRNPTINLSSHSTHFVRGDMKLIKAVLWSASASLFILIIAVPTFKRVAVGGLFPPPTPAQRHTLILTLVGLSIYLTSSRLQASRRRALRRLPPVLDFVGPVRHEPMLWHHDVGVMESIGEVGLLQPVPLNFGRRRDTNDELKIPL